MLSRLQTQSQRPGPIALGQAAGFSLDEIALMFGPGGRPCIDGQMLAAKADELDTRIREPSVMRDGPRHATACLAWSHMECPIFRHLLRAAASGAAGARRKKVCNLIQACLGGIRKLRVASRLARSIRSISVRANVSSKARSVSEHSKAAPTKV